MGALIPFIAIQNHPLPCFSSRNCISLMTLYMYTENLKKKERKRSIMLVLVSLYCISLVCRMQLLLQELFSFPFNVPGIKK